MRDYELMTIHHPDLEEDEVSTKIDELESLLQGEGAEVTNKHLWGRRRFAYEINHITEGHYSLVTFSSEPDAVSAADRVLGLADEVIRHKILVSKGESTSPTPPSIDTKPVEREQTPGIRRSREA